MSAVLPRRRTGRGIGRAPFFALVVILLLAGLLTHPRDAHGQTDDSIPTWWHEAAGLTPLLTAPPPPNPATICIIDTGVTPTPDLNITARWAYDGGTLDDVRATEDSPGHGTLVAHFAAAAVNGWGGAGAFPHARISSVRVFPRTGGASWQDYIRAITRCLKLDAGTKVIVISIGGQRIDPGEADELRHHVEQARDLYDVNVVVAAGNGGGSADFPGRFAAAFNVAAGEPDGLCSFSARGEGVDVTAPGCGLPQAAPNGALWSFDGTSFAAPIVAGLLAALRSYASLSAVEAEAVVVGSARGGVAAVDATSALRTAGLEGLLPQSPAAEEKRRTTPVPGPAASPALEIASSAAQLPRPHVVALRRRNGASLFATNRPRGALLHLRAGNREMHRRGSRVKVRTRSRRVRLRFVRGGATSVWMTVRW